MKRLFKTISIMSIIIVLSSLFGILMLAGSYRLPTWWAQKHMDESLETFAIETAYFHLYDKSKTYDMLDNFTDAVMLGTAEYNSSKSTFLDAVYCERESSIGAVNPAHSFYLEYLDPYVQKITTSYPRYWHGYLIVLKPMLILFNYLEIRTVNLIAQSILSLMCIGILLLKKNLRIYIPAFLILLILQDVYLISHSLQYSSMFYVYMSGTIFLLLFYEKLSKTKAFYFYFLGLGILTCYFDFLTYPLITYGIPVTVYLILEENPNVYIRTKNVVVYGLSWIFGYAGMWLCKGLVGSIIARENIMADILSSVSNRTASGNSGNFSRLGTIQRNLDIFANNPFVKLTALAFALCLLILVLIMLRKKPTTAVDSIKNVFPFLLVSLSPFCWYFVLSNHSWIHAWFTYRALYVTAFSLVCLLTKNYKELLCYHGNSERRNNA